MSKLAIFEPAKKNQNQPTFAQNSEKMEQLILTQLGLLPESLQLEALHYIQFLVEKSPARARLDKSRRAGILRAIQFARSNRRKTVSKIEIPSRDERNAR